MKQVGTFHIPQSNTDTREVLKKKHLVVLEKNKNINLGK